MIIFKIFRETSFTEIDKIKILSSVSTLLLKAILVKDSKKITLKMKHLKAKAVYRDSYQNFLTRILKISL